MAKDQSISGVGGWLGWFVFALMVLGPILAIGGQEVEFTKSELANPALKLLDSWNDYKLIAKFTVYFLVGLRIYAGYLLLNKHVSQSVKTTKKILWITGPIATVFLNVIVVKLVFDSAPSGEVIPQIIKDTLNSLVWIWYLNKSVRVKNTYK